MPNNFKLLLRDCLSTSTTDDLKSLQCEPELPEVKAVNRFVHKDRRSSYQIEDSNSDDECARDFDNEYQRRYHRRSLSKFKNSYLGDLDHQTS